VGGLRAATPRNVLARRKISGAQITLQTVRRKTKVNNELAAQVHCFEHCSLRFHRTALVFDFSDSCEYCGWFTDFFSLKDSVERLSCKLIRKQFPFQRLTVGYPIGLRPASLPVTVIRSRSLLDAVH